MSYEQPSDNRNNPTKTMDGMTLYMARGRRAFKMDRRDLLQLLAEGHVNEGLELALSMKGMLDSEGSVIVVMDGPVQDPPDPPIPATGGSTVSLQSLEQGEVTAYTTSDTDLERLKLKNLRFVKLEDLGGGVPAEQRLVALMEDLGGEVAVAEQSLMAPLENLVAPLESLGGVAGAKQRPVAQLRTSGRATRARRKGGASTRIRTSRAVQARVRAR
jgi:hypothetical protein